MDKVTLKCGNCGYRKRMLFDEKSMPKGTSIIEVNSCPKCHEDGGYYEEIFLDSNWQVISSDRVAEGN